MQINTYYTIVIEKKNHKTLLFSTYYFNKLIIISINNLEHQQN